MKSPLKNSLWLAVFCLAAFGLTGAAEAQTNISNSPNWLSSCPRLAVDPAGNVHVVWAEFYDFSWYPETGDAFYAKYDIASKRWSTPVNLSKSRQCASGEAYCVGIDVDGSGNVYVVYVDRPRIMLRVLSGGSWSAPFEVGSSPSTDIDSARVAVDESGNIYVAWCDSGYRVIYSRARVGGTWEKAAILTTPGSVSKFPEISVGKSQVYCVFMDNHSVPYQYNASYARRAKAFGSAWSAAQRMTNAVESEEHPAVRVDGDDVAHVVYTPYLDGIRDVRYVKGTANGFTAPVVLGSEGGVHYPSLAARGTNVFTCWQAWGVHYNNYVGGAWQGENLVPNSACYALTDVAASPSQDKIYYVWDTGNDGRSEIIFTEMQGPGPTTPTVPLAIPKHAVGDFDGDKVKEVAVDFGAAGVWLWDTSYWVQLSNANPESLIPADLAGAGDDEIVGDFGSLGVWFYDYGVWIRMSDANPKSLVAADFDGDRFDEIVGDFDSLGVWVWNNNVWTRIHDRTAVHLLAADIDNNARDELVADFGTSSLWVWVGSRWYQLATCGAESLKAADIDGDQAAELLGDFGTLGAWFCDNNVWTQKSYRDPSFLMAADIDNDRADEVIGDFGPAKLWLWNYGTWYQLADTNAESVIAADVDGDQSKELIGDFGAKGLWLWDNNVWTQLRGANAEEMLAGDADGDGREEILVDFGAEGLWAYNDGVWTRITDVNPE